MPNKYTIKLITIKSNKRKPGSKTNEDNKKNAKKNRIEGNKIEHKKHKKERKKGKLISALKGNSYSKEKGQFQECTYRKCILIPNGTIDQPFVS